MKHKYLFTLLFLFIATGAKAQTIFTFAGDSNSGYNGDNIPAVTSELNHPIGVAVDGAGDIYIGDKYNNRIRKVNTSGIITTIAGTGIAGYSGDGGIATNAQISSPFGLVIDKIGNVFFADNNNSRVRRIDTAGVITTIAGTGIFGYNGDNIMATSAELNSPEGIAIDANDNIYIADGYNNRIRKITSQGIITTYAGNGTAGLSGDNDPATIAELYNPYGITIDDKGNLYIACYNGCCIRMVNTIGIINTIAGSGSIGYSGDGGAATDAEINAIDVATDMFGDVYITDAFHHVVRMVNTSGIISTIAGNGIGGYNGDGIIATEAELNEPIGVTLDNSGDIYIADFHNSRIRLIKNTLGIKKLNNIEDGLIIYPNPSNGEFTINPPSDINGIVTITISNEYGEIVKQINAINNQPITITLDLPGLYFLSASCADGDWSGRIIISP